MKERRYAQTFRYRDCDAFAGFLHGQSLQGWHFKGFKAGLVFEHGEPADIYYAVEVFPKGTEMDTRPEKETEEYAEYCRAAGWKLIDSSRKFCVFCRTQEHAAPIVEPEERFENIQKAEWRLWLGNALPVFLISAIQCGQMLTLNFKNWMFSEMMLFVLLFMLLACIERLADGVGLLYWSFTRKRMLKSGIIPIYGRKRHRIPRPFVLILLFILVFFLVFHPHPYLLPMAVMLVLSLLVTGVIALYRPAREDNYICQIAAGAAIFFCFVIVMVASVLSDPDTESTPESTSAFPLIQADYRQMGGEISIANADHMSSIMGEKSYFMMTYTLDDEISDSLNYTIYQSSHTWILDRLWEDERPKPEEHPEDRTQIWDAVSALSRINGNSTCKEVVRYPDKLLVLITDERLDDQQIACIREKLRYYGKRSISDIN